MATETKKTYTRFSASDRMEHMVLIISFTMLGVTGLPQRYAEYQLAKDIIDLLGGIESIRVMHRFFATMLMGLAIYHGGVLSYKIYVRGSRLSMLPSLRDARDALQVVLYNLGFRKLHPKLPRFNFGEKAEYLAVVWGTILMVITGFMMWNPIATTKILPGEFIPAARLAHSAEAVLAFLSIIIWHMYNVHIKRFNRAMFTGKISHEAMVEEHSEELEMIERGDLPPTPPSDVIARRKKRFIPYAVVMTILLVAGLIYFVTFEDSALETVPRQPITQVEDIDVSVGNAETGASLWSTLPCSGCHGANAEGVPPIPALNTAIDLQDFAIAVRRGPADMPAFPSSQVSNTDIAHLYAWLQSER